MQQPILHVKNDSTKPNFVIRVSEMIHIKRIRKKL